MMPARSERSCPCTGNAPSGAWHRGFEARWDGFTFDDPYSGKAGGWARAFSRRFKEGWDAADEQLRELARRERAL